MTGETRGQSNFIEQKKLRHGDTRFILFSRAGHLPPLSRQCEPRRPTTCCVFSCRYFDTPRKWFCFSMPYRINNTLLHCRSRVDAKLLWRAQFYVPNTSVSLSLYNRCGNSVLTHRGKRSCFSLS